MANNRKHYISLNLLSYSAGPPLPSWTCSVPDWALQKGFEYVEALKHLGEVKKESSLESGKSATLEASVIVLRTALVCLTV